MGDLVGQVVAFVRPGRRVIHARAEGDRKERAYVPCEAILVFARDGTWERYDDYWVWQSTIYRNLGGPIRVYRITRDTQRFGVLPITADKLLDAVEAALETEALLLPAQPAAQAAPASAPVGDDDGF